MYRLNSRHAKRLLSTTLVTLSIPVTVLAGSTPWGTNPKPANWKWPGYSGAWKTVEHTNPTQDVASVSTAFSQQVKCNGTPIGTLDFLYRPYTVMSPPCGPSHPNCPTDHSGASMVGGFTANGNMPCGTDGYKENTQFKFIQLVKTNISGSPKLPNGAWFVDNPEAKNSTTEEPFYPYEYTEPNPAGGNFNASYHDAAFGPEFAGIDRDWLAETMLVCTNGSKINLVGSFRYGYQTPQAQAGESTHDGIVRLNSTPAHGYVEPSAVNQNEIERLRTAVKGSQSRMGWTISTGCCCPTAKPKDGSSAANGDTEFVIAIPPNTTVQSVAVFPRNQQIDWSGGVDLPGWYAEPSDFWGVPLLPDQSTPNEMYQEGIYLYPEEPLVGPMSVIITLPLTGHESFLDVFTQDMTWDWSPWVIRTDHLLGDMNDDGLFNQADQQLLQTAINDPEAYSSAFPWMDATFAGDFGHDGTLDESDAAQLDAHINHGVPQGDGAPQDSCPADLDGNELIDVEDLMQIIGAWGFCEYGCVEDINDDELVDVQDLLELIDHWGSCSDEG